MRRMPLVLVTLREPHSRFPAGLATSWQLAGDNPRPLSPAGPRDGGRRILAPPNVRHQGGQVGKARLWASP